MNAPRLFPSDIEALVGMRFSKLIVSAAERPTGKHVVTICKCDCGNVRTIRAVHLLDGVQVSCGCHKRGLKTTHGKTGTRTYSTWRNMLGRCELKTHNSFPSYGGRGILVCERWHEFESFYSDMGECPNPSASIDRIDVDGNYEPNNCRWASPMEQMNNTRRNHIIVYDGMHLTIAEALRKSGSSLCYRTFHGRIQKGWSVERALENKGSGK